jgi:AGCS family alanine or glycine:cation symporter
MRTLSEQIQAVDSFVWQPFAMPLALLLIGGVITLITGGVQIRRFSLVLRITLRSIQGKSAGDGTITQFQALSTALASTVGNGNIGGVATAILIGGPGAIFWMWVCAAVGMATKYAEAILGVHHRVTRETGELASGPMYYISNGIPNATIGKTLAMMFAFFGACGALLGTGNMAQSNTIARTFVAAMRTVVGIDVPMWFPGLLITVIVGLVLLGGIRRIAAVAERIVPTMIVLYLVSTITYLLLNLNQVPEIFSLILSQAFSPISAIGGFAGASVAQAIATGVSRGVLSNEAGLGTAPIAHGIAKVQHPVDQGLIGIFEVFIDTIVLCSLTAFVILTSGLWTDPAFQNSSGDLTAAALSTAIPGASLIVATCSFLFGFSTLIGWCYYGEKCVEFLFGSRIITAYRITFTALIMVGSMASVPLVWALGTLLNGFMAFPNLIGLLFLTKTIRKLTLDYFAKGSNNLM